MSKKINICLLGLCWGLVVNTGMAIAHGPDTEAITQCLLKEAMPTYKFCRRQVDSNTNYCEAQVDSHYDYCVAQSKTTEEKNQCVEENNKGIDNCDSKYDENWLACEENFNKDVSTCAE